jgi:hypothetical protein
MTELSDILIDVWNQVPVHDSKVVTLGSETFPVIRSKKKRFDRSTLSSMGCREVHNARPRVKLKLPMPFAGILKCPVELARETPLRHCNSAKRDKMNELRGRSWVILLKD